jgi:hypothetical protein
MDKRTIALLHLEPRTDEELHQTIERFREKYDHKRNGESRL